MEKNSSGHLRGLHVVVIDPFDGKVKFAKVFDTYKDSMDLEYFITSEHIPRDFIIVAASEDDASTELMDNCKDWFKDMGS